VRDDFFLGEIFFTLRFCTPWLWERRAAASTSEGYGGERVLVIREPSGSGHALYSGEYFLQGAYPPFAVRPGYFFLLPRSETYDRCGCGVVCYLPTFLSCGIGFRLRWGFLEKR
jgi:hypothetical protein